MAPQGAGFREGDLQPRSEPVTQTLPGGQRVEYSLPKPAGQDALRELPTWARGLRTVQWKATDPNGDPLRYRVEVRPREREPWTEVGEDLDATSFTWDTQRRFPTAAIVCACMPRTLPATRWARSSSRRR